MLHFLPRFINGIDYDADDAEEKEQAMINTFKEHYTGDSIFEEELSITPCNGYPEYILEIFLANMIEKEIDKTLQSLVAGWNQETFKFELRPACKTWRLFPGLHLLGSDHEYTLNNSQNDATDASSDYKIRVIMSDIERVVIQLLRHIVRELNSKDGSGTSIRCLDLSEFLFYDGSSTMFDIINEECRSNVCSKCDKPHAPEKPRGEDCCCKSCNRLTIKINLHARQAVYLLRSALTAVKETFVDLIVTGWAMGYVYDHQAVEESLNILRELGPDNVSTYCFTTDEIFYGLLTELHNLKKLDLNYCNYCEKEGSKREIFLSFLSEALKDMNHLEALYLDEQRLTDNLQALLGGAGSDSLQHLVLKYCVLSKSDLTFLGQSVFAEYLRNLDISNQGLEIEGLEALFEGCKNITVLEMGFSWLKPMDTDIDDLFQLLTSLQNLKFLNVGNFKDIDSDVVLSKVNYIREMPNLKCIRMRYRISEREKEEYDSEDVEFQGKLQAALDKTGADNHRLITVVFTYSQGECTMCGTSLCICGQPIRYGESSDED